MVGLFRVADPSEARGKAITAREILEAGGRRIDTELRGEPAVQADLMDTIGTVYAGLGLYDDATGMLEEALAKRRSLPVVDPLFCIPPHTARTDPPGGVRAAAVNRLHCGASPAVGGGGFPCL